MWTCHLRADIANPRPNHIRLPSILSGRVEEEVRYAVIFVRGFEAGGPDQHEHGKAYGCSRRKTVPAAWGFDRARST